MVAINLNADMGEGFGAYDIGNDAALLQVIKSASIACGFHAGDPVIMRRVCEQAKAAGVSIGAHPGFNDLWGFGRRRIDMRADEVEAMVAYQIGALQAMAACVGAKVTHVKAHGALNNVAAENADWAMAIGRAIKAVDPDLIYVAIASSQMEHAGRELNLRVASEGFCDRLYEDDGNLTSRKIPGAVIRDPEAAARQALHIVTHGEVISRNGKPVPQRVDTLCVHGDEATGVAVAKGVRAAFEAAGIAIVPLTEMPLA